MSMAERERERERGSLDGGGRCFEMFLSFKSGQPPINHLKENTHPQRLFKKNRSCSTSLKKA